MKLRRQSKGTPPGAAEMTNSDSSAESTVLPTLQEGNAHRKPPADVPLELNQDQTAVEEDAPSTFLDRVASQYLEALRPAEIEREDDGRDSLKEALNRVLLPKRVDSLLTGTQELDRRLAKLERTSEKIAEPSSQSDKQKQRSKSLPAKEQDLSEYFDCAKLTTRQREVISLRLEYGLSVREIAKRLGRSRKTIDEHLHAAHKKIAQTTSKIRRDRKRAEQNPESQI